ncbi:MAG: hypothetical protein K2X77_04630 [Candidatus Obscuribacterales bacterium]|nr:hypothetical protein [Candidatus Obscuribacterales bacterium]
MAQRKPEEQSTFDQVLKLVEHLEPEAQERLVEEMKLQWLRRALDEGEGDLEEGRTVSLEQLEERFDFKKRDHELAIVRVLHGKRDLGKISLPE